MDHSRYLADHQEHECPDEESHGHQIRETDREIQAVMLRSRPDIEEDDKGLHNQACGIPQQIILVIMSFYNNLK